MALEGRANRYGTLAAALHWLSALAILAMLPLGFAAAHAGDPARATALLRLHLPLGLAVLALTLARIAWALVDVRPEAPPGQPRWQHRLARGNHILLYALVVLLSVSGIGLIALSGAAPAIFAGDAGRLPDFSTLPPMAVHAASALGLVGLLACHFGAVAYHQIYRRDSVLARMRVGRSTGSA